MDKQYINNSYAPKLDKCNQCWKDIWPQISAVINKEISRCTLCVTLFETVWQVTDTVWLFNTGQGNTKRPIGTLQMVTMTT